MNSLPATHTSFPDMGNVKTAPHLSSASYHPDVPIPEMYHLSSDRPIPSVLSSQPRLIHRNIRPFRQLPLSKNYAKRRAVSYRLEELRQALDLTKYISQIQDIINQPIKIPGTVSLSMARKKKLPVKPKKDLLSIRDVWGNDEQRRDELRSMFNTSSVGEREFLLKLMLDESDDDSPNEESITEEDLRHMIRIHRKRRRLQKIYHHDPLNSQYTYYGAGLLSEQDIFPSHQQSIRQLFMAEAADFEKK